MPTHLLQLTDLHLFADPDEQLKGVSTRESLADVLETVRGTGLSFDHVLVTGDLTHDERRETYEVVRELLGEWLGCCRIVPGNHDDRALMREVFPDCTEGEATSVRFSVAAGTWRLLGIDTHVPGEVAGRVSPGTLEWLEAELAAHAGDPTILFEHHPPAPIGCEWLDGIGLEDPGPLVDLLARSPQVRVISCGHVHQAFRGRLGEAVLLTTPSTSVQFQPGTIEPILDPLPPGFRVFTLEGDRWDTRVVRVPENGRQ